LICWQVPVALLLATKWLKIFGRLGVKALHRFKSWVGSYKIKLLSVAMVCRRA
jgi:hypothetical protein